MIQILWLMSTNIFKIEEVGLYKLCHISKILDISFKKKKQAFIKLLGKFLHVSWSDDLHFNVIWLLMKFTKIFYLTGTDSWDK